MLRTRSRKFWEVGVGYFTSDSATLLSTKHPLTVDKEILFIARLPQLTFQIACARPQNVLSKATCGCTAAPVVHPCVNYQTAYYKCIIFNKILSAMNANDRPRSHAKPRFSYLS